MYFLLLFKFFGELFVAFLGSARRDSPTQQNKQTKQTQKNSKKQKGTGKTSLAMALAGELGLPIYVVTLSSPSMHDEALRQLLNSAAPR